MTNDISKILAISTLIEAIISYINCIFCGDFPYQIILSIIFGILISVCYKLDIFAMIGVKSGIPYVGCVLSGILLSRGANYLYDLIGKFTNF